MMSGLPQGRSGHQPDALNVNPGTALCNVNPGTALFALSLVRRYPIQPCTALSDPSVRRYPNYRTYTPEPGENIPIPEQSATRSLSLGLEPGPLWSGTRPWLLPTHAKLDKPFLPSLAGHRPAAAMVPGSFCQEYFFSSAMVADASAPPDFSVALIHCLVLHDSAMKIMLGDEKFN